LPDDTVDALDVLLILSQCGTGGPEADSAGFEGAADGIVDVPDLVAVLAAWSECL